jgi:hypothetical protein
MQFMVERNVRGECDYRNLQQLVFYYFILWEGDNLQSPQALRLLLGPLCALDLGRPFERAPIGPNILLSTVFKHLHN